MELITYQKGDVLFRQGERQKCMYVIMSGTVGIYKDFGTERENLIAELGARDFLGEMELIENAPRSATAVVLSDRVEVDRISDDHYLDFFEQNPVQVYLIMKQLSARLRETTKNYDDACRTVYETLHCAETGEEPSAWLKEHQQRFCGQFEAKRNGAEKEYSRQRAG